MKSRYKILYIIIVTVFSCLKTEASSLSEIDWKNLGKKIKDETNKIGSKVKKGLNTATDKIKHSIKKGANKAKACSEVVSLGIQWTALQGSLQTAKGILEASEKLQKADPRLIGLLAAEKTAEASLESAQTMLDVAQKTSTGIANATSFMGEIASNGLNIENIAFKTTSQQLMKGESPPLIISGTMAGKNFEATVKGVDYSSSQALISSILKNLNL